MKSLMYGREILEAAKKFYNECTAGNIPTKLSGPVGYPTEFTPSTYLNNYVTMDVQTAAQLPTVNAVGKKTFCMTSYENSGMHLLLSNALNFQKNVLSHLKTLSNDMEIFRNNNQYLYDMDYDGSVDVAIIKEFIDYCETFFQPTGNANKFITLLGFQLINTKLARFSVEECDLLFCTLDMNHATITDGKFINSCNVRNSDVVLGNGVSIIGSRFYNCNITYGGGKIVIADNNASNARSNIFNNCNVNNDVLNNLIDKSGNSLSGKII